jgi:hypothetical protein
MREDGFEFDKWLMTNDRDMGRPQDAGPGEHIYQSDTGLSLHTGNPL